MIDRAFTVAALALAMLAPAARLAAQGPVLPTLRTALDATADVAEAAPEPAPEHDALAADMADGRTTRGFARHRILHFTFDDGPRAATTPRVLETLDAYGVRATFFVVGRQLEGARGEGARALVREMAARGHTVGTHTWDHANLTRLTEAQVESQLERSERAFEATLGGRPWLVRPPYGARDARVDALLARRGYTAMLWNLTSSDTVTRDPDVMVERFRAQLDRQERHPLGPGGIVLFHDTHEHTVEALPRILDEVRARNCALLEQPGEELWDLAGDPRLYFQARQGTAAATSVRLDAATLAARQTAVRAEAETYCR
ncbi:MAG: polysaccharide deacetylase family protein [Sandaracinaceae bacterium]|nr:polysaccharide deacetylase family protein [Sandaracinaceae bacterium]